ncbi:MAG: phosphodiester glycosidase family protein [Kiritimatiellae bacterium]|nr:phosphodiester glycosidase family protein [Kiritimatiellia bacterium]
MKAKVSAIVFLAACCLCLPVVATAATAGDTQLGVPPEHEMWQRPVELCRGVTLRAYALDEPQLMKAFVARINLDEPGIGFTATDRDEKWGEPMPDYTNRTMLIHTKRETTPNFMMQRRAAGEPVVLAVNATPWGPWDCAAAFRSTYASLKGWNVSHGVELSQPKRPRRGALFVVYRDGKADITTSVAEERAKDVAFVFDGFGLIMTNGVPTVYARRLKNQAPAQRTAFGLDASRKTLVLLVVDGRKPNYSIGAFGMDLYEILRREGVTDAVNMDGGGSSTLTVFDVKRGKPWTFTRSNPRRNALNVGITLKGASNKAQ